MWIQTGVTVRKRLSWVVTSVTLTFDLWPWTFAWTLLWSLVITPENFMMIRWWEHSQTGVTDRQTDGRTDGQTDGQTKNTICRAAGSQLTRSYRLRDGCSIFTAEVEAIDKALKYVKVSSVERFVIFFDSMSVLQAIESQESKNPLVNRVLQTCQRILSGNKYITFCWIPSHRDIGGNEDADRAAKDALSKAQPENFDIPCTDVFMKIQPFILSLWQERWDKEVDNKLHAIMPQIDEKYYSGCTNRKDEVIINRLRIGHTHLTHSFRMENRPHPPLCDQCEGDHELTVKHILIECSFLKIIRRRHYDVTDLNQLFKTVSSKRILDFVKDIGLYSSL